MKVSWSVVAWPSEKKTRPSVSSAAIIESDALMALRG